MEYDESSRTFNIIAGVALGVIVGAGVALLLAPDSGRRTRRRVLHVASGARSAASDRLGDFADDAKSLVKSGRKRLGL